MRDDLHLRQREWVVDHLQRLKMLALSPMGRMEELEMRTLCVVGIVAALLVGCTHAGPFVTNISASGNGRAVVEKCMLEMNYFLGTISESDCDSSTVLLVPQRERRRSNARRGR